MKKTVIRQQDLITKGEEKVANSVLINDQFNILLKVFDIFSIIILAT